MPITNLQIQRFQKYFQIIEEFHTIELGAVNFTDEKLQNFLNGTTNWNTTFAKTSRDWYRCKQRQSCGFTIAFSNNPIRELKTADQLNEFIQNDMEYELLKGFFNHYIYYFDLNTKVDIKSIDINEWICTLEESIVHIYVNDGVYTLNQNVKFETPRGLALYILKQKFEINTDDVY